MPIRAPLPHADRGIRLPRGNSRRRLYDDPLPREHTSILASLEGLSSPFDFYRGGNPFISAFLNPRLSYGAMVSVEGGTSYGFAGSQLARADLRPPVRRGRVRRRGQ